MTRKTVALIAGLAAGALPFADAVAERYEAKWESLDRRPVPQWWRDAKFGIFIHWGPYAVPAFAPVNEDVKYSNACYAEWYQGFMGRGVKPVIDHHAAHYGGMPYGNFASQFKAENFDAKAWAKLFKAAGAKYVVLTSKHHDGFALWPSPESPYYNAVAMGPGRDIAREYVDAMSEAGLKRGFYYSLIEYANPLYPGIRDGKSDAALTIGEWCRRVNVPQLKELATQYKADIIWTDGDWEYPSSEYLSEEFLAWLYNESPVRDTVVANDRWGKECRGHHGGHYTSEYGTEEGGERSGFASQHPWEENRGIGKSYGYNGMETPAHYMSREKCVETLAMCVSAGGNLLLNVGPTSDGRIPPIMQDRLLAIGGWLKVNGEAIYGTTRGDLKADAKRVYFTRKGDVRYAIDFRGDGRPFAVTGVAPSSRVTLVGSEVAVETRTEDGKLVIVPPTLAPADRPCEFALVYRIGESR